jgi:hypothetical protein
MIIYEMSDEGRKRVARIKKQMGGRKITDPIESLYPPGLTSLLIDRIRAHFLFRAQSLSRLGHKVVG